VVEGVEDVVIDPLSRLTAGMSAGDANQELERIADEISSLAKDLQFTYYIFCHLKAPTGGRPHEEGGRVHSNQFTGSRAMMRACYYMIGIERDKSPDLPDVVRNMSSFVLLEDRAFGNSGRFDVYYDKDTGDYLEPDMDVVEEYNELRGA
jgi:twinkle protein